MAIATIHEFVAALRESRVLPDPQLETVVRELAGISHQPLVAGAGPGVALG
jgi:hypothetical protein